jgi:hypothetical protein
MFGNLYIVVCWDKKALIGVFSDEKQALEIANQYATFHKCEVNIQKYTAGFGDD